jgi:hypothetical protein
LVSEQVPSRKHFNHWKEIMDYTNIGIPKFDGEDYAFWRRRMKTYVQEQGFDVWRAVVNGYKAPTTPSMDKYGKKLEDDNARAKKCSLEWFD